MSHEDKGINLNSNMGSSKELEKAECTLALSSPQILDLVFDVTQHVEDFVPVDVSVREATRCVDGFTFEALRCCDCAYSCLLTDVCILTGKLTFVFA